MKKAGMEDGVQCLPRILPLHMNEFLSLVNDGNRAGEYKKVFLEDRTPDISSVTLNFQH